MNYELCKAAVKHVILSFAVVINACDLVLSFDRIDDQRLY